MRIAHVSDIHIRNLKFHADYRRVFDNFYQKLDDLKVDAVVNTGDTAHTKTNISPEFVEMASEFFVNTAKYGRQLAIILGNHDLNLMNEDRQDAITPIVDALNNPKIVLWKNSGPNWLPLAGQWPWTPSNFVFWNFGISDVGNWPRGPYEQVALNRDPQINIGLFHGSIKNCITDSNFRMTNVEYDQDIFEGLDFVMMGDIHKRQEFNDGRVRYAGSMVQQNFGEDPDKGFLIWDIRGKDDFEVTFHELKGNRRFYTVKLPEGLQLPEMNIEPGSRIRVAPPRQLTLVEQKAIEKLVRKKWSPHDVITLGAQNIGQMFAQVDGKSHRIENLRDLSVQEQLLNQYLAPRKIKEDVAVKILDLNRKYQVAVEQRETIARGVNWRILKMGWNNLYNYGEGNVVDFSQIKGVSGIFAPNASGKSGFVDVVTIGTWDANTKEVSKNVHLVNDNKDLAVIILEMLANGERFTITRQIERIKQGQRSGQEREWGKTTLEFLRHDKDGGVEKLVGELRPDTEKNIRRRFGTFDDFMLTGLFAQWDPMDLIMCKETDRKRILFRFLDLDIFEEKAKLAKEDYKEWAEKLLDLEESNYESLRDQLVEQQTQDNMALVSEEGLKGAAEAGIQNIHEEIESLSRQIIPVTFSFRKVEPALFEQLRKKIDEAKGSVLVHEAEVGAYEGDIHNIEIAMAAYDSELSDKRVARYEELQEALYSLRATIKEREKHLATQRKQIELLETVPCGDSFPGCKFLINAFTAKRKLPEEVLQVAELEVEAEKIQREIKELEPTKELWEVHKQELEELHNLKRKLDLMKLRRENAQLTVGKLEAELTQAQVELERYEQVKRDLEKNDEIQSQISELKETLQDRERGLKLVEQHLNELYKTMGARQTDIARLDKQIAQAKEVKDTCSAFEHFLAAMGKDGIALQVLTQKLPLINEEINKILSSACEFGVYIEYEPEDQSIRLYIQYGQYRSRLLELGSGAEKFLASIAIRSALLSISNLPRSNMFIIDEGFGKLDPQNLESIQRIFDYLRSVFDHVIVISHTDVMKDFVDNVIDITADDEGYAHIEIGG